MAIEISDEKYVLTSVISSKHLLKFISISLTTYRILIVEVGPQVKFL